jgi:hypothetical protein
MGTTWVGIVVDIEHGLLKGFFFQFCEMGGLSIMDAQGRWAFFIPVLNACHVDSFLVVMTSNWSL